MDPNATLENIRRLVERITVAADRGDNPRHIAEDGAELAEAVGNLDEWLSRGGFPPRDWSNGARGGV